MDVTKYKNKMVESMLVHYCIQLDTFCYIGEIVIKYCGREFSDTELEYIRRLSKESGMTRLALSKQVCREFEWRKPDGGLKDMSCRVALLRMQADNLVQLPAPLHQKSTFKYVIARTAQTEQQATLLTPVKELQRDRFQGTCYRAANWICLGHTCGRGKLDRTHTCSLPIKSVWVFPLTQHFRQILTE